MFFLAALGFIGVTLAFLGVLPAAISRWRDGRRRPLVTAILCGAASAVAFGAALRGLLRYDYYVLAVLALGPLVADCAINRAGPRNG